ncbi:glycosyl transferase [Legionella quinlivanii]|uniref:Glycosyl transferase n=1 Tax=Legionella quinlivanii TaxID=45073 RepID=A0A364LNP7_9GAMM|nr:glycosyltransferase [Legionella quinlivanii]RAP38460.1 glycosyl transferase [Legionella quinlivanii]
MSLEPLVTIVVPSYNQGCFLNDALASIFQQNLPVEVFVMDGGSTDCTAEIIDQWKNRLSGWRIARDEGQAQAINEGISRGKAPYVCWLNSDDWFLANSLRLLLNALESAPEKPAAYGRSWNVYEKSGQRKPVWVEAFCEDRLASRCIISQPASLIRRSAWEAVGGVDASLHMAMDYDLWWRLFKSGGPLLFIDEFIAVNRIHPATKTRRLRRLHYQEAIQTVSKYYGRVPWKWWLAQPYSVWYKLMLSKMS